MPLRRLSARAQTVALARMLKAAGRPVRRGGRPARQAEPKLIAKEYWQAIRHVAVAPILRAADRAKELAVRGLRLLRERRGQTDAIDDEATVRELIRRAGARAAAELQPKALADVARKFGQRTGDFQKAELSKQVRQALGVPIEAVEKPIRDPVPEFVKENVELIKTVPDRYFDRLEREVADAFVAGTHPRVLAERLMDIDGMAERDAMRIARDQIGKLNAQFNEERQKSLGAESYIWRTMRDNRVRDEHTEREGQEFRWDDPPEDGHPGEPIQCRCYAEPVFNFAAEEE